VDLDENSTDFVQERGAADEIATERRTRRPHSEGHVMDQPLYDHYLDNDPYRDDDPTAGTMADFAGEFDGGKGVKESSEGAGWLDRLRLSDIMMIGVVVGLILASPLLFRLMAANQPKFKMVEAGPVARPILAPAPAPAPPPIQVPVTPPVNPGTRPVVGLARVMDGVRSSAASSDWFRAGQPDSDLVLGVQAILDEVKEAAGEDRDRMPVQFDEVKATQFLPVGRNGESRIAEGMLHVTTSPMLADGRRGPAVLEVARAERSILVAHGDILISSANDCLIVATGAVRVNQSKRCAIIAGRIAEASNDEGSLIVSGSKLSADQFTWGRQNHDPTSVYAAPDLLQASRSYDLVVINSPLDDIRESRFAGIHSRTLRSIRWPTLDLADESLADRIDLDESVAFLPRPIDGSREYGIDVRTRHRSGAAAFATGIGPILDPDGKPLEELDGWNIYRISRNYTMLFKGDRLVDVGHRGGNGTMASAVHSSRSGRAEDLFRLPNRGFLESRLDLHSTD
jgi:hypothetical protein